MVEVRVRALHLRTHSRQASARANGRYKTTSSKLKAVAITSAAAGLLTSACSLALRSSSAIATRPACSAAAAALAARDACRERQRRKPHKSKRRRARQDRTSEHRTARSTPNADSRQSGSTSCRHSTRLHLSTRPKSWGVYMYMCRRTPSKHIRAKLIRGERSGDIIWLPINPRFVILTSSGAAQRNPTRQGRPQPPSVLETNAEPPKYEHQNVFSPFPTPLFGRKSP